MNSLLFEIVRANVRNPVEVEGDLYSLAACNDIGGRRLVDMMSEFSIETLDVLGEQIIAMSRVGMMAEIEKLPWETGPGGKGTRGNLISPGAQLPSATHPKDHKL